MKSFKSFFLIEAASPELKLHRNAHRVDGKLVDSETKQPVPAHIQSLKVPPAWANVSYHPDKTASLMATGLDSKGRKQYVYSTKANAAASKAKFERIKQLSSKMKTITSKNDALRNSKDPIKAEHADLMHLVMHTGLRPGSEEDTGAEKKAYGATTLEGRHVVSHEGAVALHFVGKKGVENHIPIHDESTASMLKERLTKAGETGKLFPNVNDSSILRHVKSIAGPSFKTKDFRTHLGTSHARTVMEGVPTPTNPKEYKKHVSVVAKAVSEKLGNTPTVALQSYIHPSVFGDWRKASGV